MAFIDDFFSTPPDERKRLQQICRALGCGHQRYQHGTTQEQRQAAWRWIEHEPGRCRLCKCDAFADDNAITKEEVLDVVDALSAEWHLADIGITSVQCEQKITRWLENGAVDVACRLTYGHEGVHEAGESS